ncbi:unnamed protein product [Protopolystoma xenopodis]|uniref:protein acetyllysine N-acetyltransferase n=1 Tax=Protopolystoma xenopodis TaxID=117903 RepID=A0A448WAQ7_9PLAT|nr:unnamed protein product [Protopolystoma xenopodis]
MRLVASPLLSSPMSVDYSAGLSPYANKGLCGQPELYDSKEDFDLNIERLATLIRSSTYTVVHTGAGISTSVGIPDFRGPKGVWTLENKGEIPNVDMTFERASPSLTHNALVALEKSNYIHYVITQNVDGLNLRSGFPRNRLSILHGDMFIDSCTTCRSSYIRKSKPSPTMRQRFTGFMCCRVKRKGIFCRGKLHDTILDWEDSLPEPDYYLALEHSRRAQLHICLGTSLQIFPSANLPIVTAKASNLFAYSAKRRKLNNDVKFNESNAVSSKLEAHHPCMAEHSMDSNG